MILIGGLLCQGSDDDSDWWINQNGRHQMLDFREQFEA